VAGAKILSLSFAGSGIFPRLTVFVEADGIYIAVRKAVLKVQFLHATVERASLVHEPAFVSAILQELAESRNRVFLLLVVDVFRGCIARRIVVEYYSRMRHLRRQIFTKTRRTASVSRRFFCAVFPCMEDTGISSSKDIIAELFEDSLKLPEYKERTAKNEREFVINLHGAETPRLASGRKRHFLLSHKN